MALFASHAAKPIVTATSTTSGNESHPFHICRNHCVYESKKILTPSRRRVWQSFVRPRQTIQKEGLAIICSSAPSTTRTGQIKLDDDLTVTCDWHVFAGEESVQAPEARAAAVLVE